MSQQRYELCKLLATLLLFSAAFSEAVGVTGGPAQLKEAAGNVLCAFFPPPVATLASLQSILAPRNAGARLVLQILLCSRTSCGKMYPSAEGNFPAAMHSWPRWCLGGHVVSRTANNSCTVHPWWNLHGACRAPPNQDTIKTAVWL